MEKFTYKYYIKSINDMAILQIPILSISDEKT